jgi:ABC-type uncharacterized transport system substrate-binding protein
VFLALHKNTYAEKILIFRQGSINFEEVAKSVKTEINNEYEIVEHIINKDSTYKEFKSKILKEEPDLLLLLDNHAVNLAKKFNQENSQYAQNLRSVAAMALNLRQELKGNKNICGIEYEVPAYTLITQFRYLVTKDIKSILVFYRQSQHQSMIDTATEQLKKEGITLKAMNTEDYGKSKKDINFYLQRNVLREVYKKDTDLIWVIPDSTLLNNENFANVWVNAARRNKKPFIAGIKYFSSPKIDFCIYSASPNHKDLGTQISEQIFTLLDDKAMAANELGVEYILSVNKDVNMKILPKYGLKTVRENMTDIEVHK